MVIEKKVFQMAAARLALLPFFPAGEIAMSLVMGELERIVHTPEQLEWLTETTLAKCARWEGPAQLRALYSTRWKPKDGIEGVPCTVAGHTPEKSEAQYLADHSKLKALPSKHPLELL